MTNHFEIPEKPVVDSNGIYFNPMLRHLDRGSQEVDNGHYLQYEYVFGATAAAALYRRAMIDDIAPDGEFFHSDFFVYREDEKIGIEKLPLEPDIVNHRPAEIGRAPVSTPVTPEP